MSKGTKLIIDTQRKIQHPIKFLMSQIKTDVDAVKLVRDARKDFK